MMTLYGSSASPYVRRVRIAALETGVMGQIDYRDINPLTDPSELWAVSPLGKVPALRLADGQAVYESLLICRLFDDMAETAGRMFPWRDSFALKAERAVVLADNITDMTVARTMELRRPEELQSAEHLDRMRRQIENALPFLEAVISEGLAPAEGDPDMIGVSTLCALEYLDFRHPDIDWRARTPAAAAWHKAVMDRDSFVATRPDMSTFEKG